MLTLAVLLPTYNAASYIKDSIDSILNQNFENFHLYIYDDFSTDDTENIISSYDDKRIFYRKNKINLGIAKTLNRGFEDLLNKYEYIARMDADDWSYHNRFDLQLKMFEHDEDLIMCGTQGYWLTEFETTPLLRWKYPVDYNALRINLLFSGSFGHSSIMFKSKFLIKNNIFYNESIRTCEDWELWTRILELGKVKNSPEYLMKYRMSPLSNHRNPKNKALHLKERVFIICQQWSNFGFEIDESDLFKFYYNNQKLNSTEFIRILKNFIKLYNDLEILTFKLLNREDQKYFRYRFTRNILTYWKNSGVSRYSLEIWVIIFLNVGFINKFNLLKNIVR